MPRPSKTPAKRAKAPPSAPQAGAKNATRSHLSKEVVATAVIGKHVNYALSLAAKSQLAVDVMHSEPRKIAKRPDGQLVLFVGADGVVTKAL